MEGLDEHPPAVVSLVDCSVHAAVGNAASKETQAQKAAGGLRSYAAESSLRWK